MILHVLIAMVAGWKAVATLVTPETLLRWYQRLIAQKFDGSTQRQQLGRPRVAEEVEQLVMRMAEENPTWGYRRIQGALGNLGHSIDKLTVRNILRRNHMEPAPQRRIGGLLSHYPSRGRLTRPSIATKRRPTQHLLWRDHPGCVTHL